MKSKFYVLLFLLVMEKIVGQPSIEIKYDYNLIGEEFKKKTFQVIASKNNSLCKLIVFTPMTKGESGETYIHKDTSFTFIDFQKKSIISQDMTFKERVLVRDSLKLFNWKLTSNTKNILGYKCQEARTNFRGRNYYAYFTDELPFRVGPWKFNGLPGVILKVKSEDDGVLMQAIYLKVKNEGRDIKFPPLTFKSFSWEDFVIKYKKDFEGEKARIISMMKQSGGPVLTKFQPESRIEILIDGNRGIQE